MKKIRLIIIGLLFFLFIVLPNSYGTDSQNEETQIIQNGIYKIKSLVSDNKYIDISAGAKDNCANVQIWEKSDVEQQSFKITYLNNGYYKIEACHSNKVLDVAGAGNTNGTNVWQYEDNGSNAQQWKIEKLNNGFFKVVSKCNKLSLDVSGGNSLNGTNIQVYEWNESSAQQFKFEEVEKIEKEKTLENGIYKINTKINNEQYLDINGGSKENGANLQIWEKSNVNQQRFKITYLNNGYYKIEAYHSNKALDVANAGQTSGTNIWQYENNGSDAQQWILKKLDNGYYRIISKCNKLSLDVSGGNSLNGTNIQVYEWNGSNAQQFKFELSEPVIGKKTISDGVYKIQLATTENMLLSVQNRNKKDGANVYLDKDNDYNSQKFQITYLNNGYYKIEAVHSKKVLDVAGAGNTNGTNIWQYEYNGSDAQQWVIKDAKNGSYNIVSKCNELYLDVSGGLAESGTNIQVFEGNGSNAQKFKFSKTEIGTETDEIDIDSSKYPLYKEAIGSLQQNHPNWTFELLYTGLSFNEAVYGEYSYHGANLVPNTSGSEWICPVCGTKEYDTGSWYCASDKAIAYYMDPRNFINESAIYQFLDVNRYEASSVSIDGIQSIINGKFLEPYASDINTACKNKGVNPYYIIARLIQENGSNGSYTSNGMRANDGKTYYNPFNIGAYKTKDHTVKENALITAMKYGWDNMEKALEGGIEFLKDSWLDNYQNTLYQNRFDIDSTNGTSLYSHQYMQNLSAAYTEGLLLKSYYIKANKTETDLTFIIPVYEGMSGELAEKPSEGVSSEEYPINVRVTTQGGTLALRSGASTSSSVITRYANGTILLSVKRGINSSWQQVVTKDGQTGYMSGEYLRQINDEWTCNYKAYIKTQSSGGTNVRTGPSTNEGFSKVGYLPDYTTITVIDDSTYKGYEGTDWCQWSRIILEDGRQAFVPSHYVIKN